MPPGGSPVPTTKCTYSTQHGPMVATTTFPWTAVPGHTARAVSLRTFAARRRAAYPMTAHATQIAAISSPAASCTSVETPNALSVAHVERHASAGCLVRASSAT